MRFSIIVVGLMIAFAINPNIFVLGKESTMNYIIAIGAVFAIWQDMVEYIIVKQMGGQ